MRFFRLQSVALVFAIAIAVGFALSALPAAAQTNSATRGGLGGVVFDSSGAVMPNVTVTVTGPQGTYVAKTDATGHYEVGGLVPGDYKVVVEANGFKKFLSDRNQIMVDHDAALDIHLAIGAATDTVQVDAGAVQIDSETTSLNAPLSDELYESLPVARNVAAIFSFAPGVVSGGGTGTSNPSIGGATGLENLYLVDGVTVTDQAFGGMGTYNRYFGSLGSSVNLAFVKEVDVKTGAFEPKYGRAAGGIVEIVTKSGSNAYHGAVAAYLGPGSFYASRMQLNSQGYVNTAFASVYSTPEYDAAAEIGGFVPGFKNKAFFFGAFNPALNQTIEQAQQGLPLFANGDYAYSATALSWAAKLTYQPTDKIQFEASSFGDPTHHNAVPTTLAAVNADSVGGRYSYGSHDSVARLSSAITPTWVVNASYTYNFNKFSFSPTLNVYSVQDRTVLPYISYGVGGYEPTKNDDYSLNVETEKKVHFFGEHTLAIGYSYDHTNFLDQPSRTGALFAIPGTNADGNAVPGIKASAVGQMTNATYRLYRATIKDSESGDTINSTNCAYCAKLADGTMAYMQEIRGTYKGLSVEARQRYHVGWANDSYQMNRFVNIDAGIRWEEQWYDGMLFNYLFNDNWSPRLGFNILPFGNQKTKVFFNFARYQSVLPLDAAIRQLGNEQDDTSFYFAPQTDASGNIQFDSTGAAVPIEDAAHTLNGTVKGTDPEGNATKFGAPSFASSTGEGILPGTKMEYENEFVLGVQREIVPGSVLSLRYTDRRLGRIVEDIGSQSPEDAITGISLNYNGGIANVNAATDIAVNEDTVTYTPAQWATANPAYSTPGAVPDAAHYTAPAAGCTYGNDFAVANGDFFRKYDGSAYNSGCLLNPAAADGSFSATKLGDGKPDGFANPSRVYQEFVAEFNRNMKNNWQARMNYRYAKLWGNYEGFFRNDNGQSDPGISSLFDFTNGALGLLGDQTKPGFLNTDRRNVLNLSVSYKLAEGKLKNLTMGTNVRGATGNPLSAFASHPVYLNTGEVPIGGRGTKGTLHTTGQVDMHLDYPRTIKEKYTMKFAFDMFNILNAQTESARNQNLDSGVGVPSPDYGLKAGFQGPFYARASMRFEF